MRQTLRQTAFAVAFAAMATAASATPLTISGSIAPNTLLGAGTTGGTFDGTGLLPPLYDINSGTFSFVFVDDTDTRSSSSTSQTTYTPYQLTQSSNPQFIFRDYVRTGTTVTQTTVTGQSEGVTASIDGQTVGSGATSPTTTVNTGTTSYIGRVTDSQVTVPGATYSVPCGNRTCTRTDPSTRTTQYTDQYGQIITTTTDWTGGFTISGILTDAMLADFRSTGLLPFNLNVTGDLYLASATMSLDITERAPLLSALPTQPTNVPEPGSLALAAAGLGGIGLARRRRTQR